MNLYVKLKHYLSRKIYSAVKIALDDTIPIEKSRKLAMIGKVGDNVNLENVDFLLGGKYISIGTNFYCKKSGWVECIDEWKGQQFHPSLSIGDNFSMQCYCHIGCVDSIRIGDNVLLGSNVYITDHFHGAISKESIALPPVVRPLWSKPVVIGNNVWIGDNVSIMPGVSLGDNVIVGANAVVTHCFPGNAVIAGCPAKVIKVLD